MSVPEPSKILTPWATSGLKNTIPQAANPVTGRAGYDQGFPPINMTAKEAGGIPPYGQDFNGILYEITKQLQFSQQGGLYTYDSAFAAAIGGYGKGAVIISPTTLALYQNQVDGNATNPESGGANWVRFGPNSYGVPMIGQLVMWPLQQMPQEIWPDIGAKFIPYMGQAFSKTTYPLLGIMHPSGILPADMRGEFPRGWDNGRGVDTGRVLMSTQSDSIQQFTGTISSRPLATDAGGAITASDGVFEYTRKGGQSGSVPIATGSGGYNLDLLSLNLSSQVRTSTETRSRNIAWNMIVRAA